MSKPAKPPAVKRGLAYPPAALVGEIRALIDETRSVVATTVNAGLTLLYWRVGKRIDEDILRQSRAGYGDEIIATLARQLTLEYGRGWSGRNLAYAVRFAQTFQDAKILQTLCAKLSWSHFKQIIYLDDPLKRDFYAELCRVEGWSTRTLQAKIASMLFERTALSRKPGKLARMELDALRDEDRMSPDLVFRDPYLLDFLGLKDRYLERDIEDAILRELERFLLEMGRGFAFMARQKRIHVDNEDYYLDLLFYHRDLNRLIAIDLKLGDFKPENKGQMEIYLRWLALHERRKGEEEPLGIILCAGKKQEMIELLQLGKSGIHVAEYLTELPPKDVLRRKLHAAIKLSRKQLENCGEAKRKRKGSAS